MYFGGACDVLGRFMGGVDFMGFYKRCAFLSITSGRLRDRCLNKLVQSVNERDSDERDQ